MVTNIQVNNPRQTEGGVSARQDQTTGWQVFSTVQYQTCENPEHMGPAFSPTGSLPARFRLSGNSGSLMMRGRKVAPVRMRSLGRADFGTIMPVKEK